MRTSSLRRVEREVVGGRVGVTDACGGAHQSFGEMLDLASVLIENHNQSVALLHGDRDGFFKTLLIGSLGHLHAVDNNLDVVVLITVNLHALHYLQHLSVNSNMHVTLTAHAFEELAVMTFTTAYYRSKNVNLMSGVVVCNHVEHTLFGITYHLLAGSKAIGATGTGKEQSHVVVNLGGGSYRRTGILVGGFLFDTDYWRKTGNLVNIRALHSTKEVAGISRESLDISALTLGKDCVESQRRFAAATQSRNHCE